MPGDHRDGKGGERPRKSFRERDAAAGRSRHTNTQSDRDRERFAQTPAYANYKQKLESFFSGGELSETMRDRLDPTGEGKERDRKLKAIRMAETPAAFAAAVSEYLVSHELPDDPYLLDRALEHPLVAVQLRALGRLELLRAEGKLAKPPASLKLRLDGLAMNADDGAVQDAAVALRKKL